MGLIEFLGFNNNITYKSYSFEELIESELSRGGYVRETAIFIQTQLKKDYSRISTTYKIGPYTVHVQNLTPINPKERIAKDYVLVWVDPHISLGKYPAILACGSELHMLVIVYGTCTIIDASKRMLYSDDTMAKLGIPLPEELDYNTTFIYELREKLLNGISPY